MGLHVPEPLLSMVFINKLVVYLLNVLCLFETKTGFSFYNKIGLVILILLLWGMESAGFIIILNYNSLASQRK